MSGRRRFISGCLLGCLMVAGATFAVDTPEDAAQAAAESWLGTVDGGDYAASWDQAARALKGGIERAEWAGMLGEVRSPVGPLVSRKLSSREYTEKAPATTRVIGGRVYTWRGPGRYVVLQYASAFAEKASAVETVIVMADPDGTWRVSGYSIR